MKNILIIWRKEMKIYFASPIAYHLMAFSAVVFGYFFLVALAVFMRSMFRSQFMGGGGPMDINEWVIRPLMMNISVIGLFVVPMISMRLYSEEKFSGTIELLMTSPVRDIEVIIGKWLGALTLYACILVTSAIPLVFTLIYGNPDWKPILVGYLGLLLQGGGLLAIGIFISSMTRNQIVAALATFDLCLLLWVFQWVSSYESTVWARVMAYLSVLTHFEPFGKGIIDSKDALYFVSVIFLGLFATSRVMEFQRWRA